MKFINFFIISITFFNAVPLYHCNKDKFKIIECYNHKISVISETVYRGQSSRTNLKDTAFKFGPAVLNLQRSVKMLNINQKNDSVEDKFILETLMSGIRETIRIFTIDYGHNTVQFLEKDLEYFDIPLQKKNYLFQAFAPENFLNLRNLYKITQEFNKSFISTKLFQLQQTTMFGSKTFYTADHKFVIRMISIKEQEVLISILSDYFTHFCESQNTLLPKISGLYYFRIDSVEYFAIIMPNIYPHPLQINVDEAFFLRGANKISLLSEDNSYEKTWLLDVDFLTKYRMGFNVLPSLHDSIKNSLNNDCTFLQKIKATNYGLAMVVIPKANCKVDTKKINNNNVFYASYFAHNLTVFIGIDNILHEYGFLRILENRYKSTVSKKAHKITIKDPITYSDRFMEFIIRNVLVRSQRA